LIWLPLLAVLIPELGLPRLHRNRVTLDINLLYIGAHIQRIAIGNHHIRGLAFVQRAQLIGNAPDLGRVEGDRLQRLVVRQPKKKRS
jgi:hypothetical protein